MGQKEKQEEGGREELGGGEGPGPPRGRGGPGRPTPAAMQHSNQAEIIVSIVLTKKIIILELLLYIRRFNNHLYITNR